MPPKLLPLFELGERWLLLVVQEARDLGEADDGIDGAHGGRALAAAREGLELGVDLRGELGQQRQLLAALGRAFGQRLAP